MNMKVTLGAAIGGVAMAAAVATAVEYKFPRPVWDDEFRAAIAILVADGKETKSSLYNLQIWNTNQLWFETLRQIKKYEDDGLTPPIELLQQRDKYERDKQHYQDLIKELEK